MNTILTTRIAIRYSILITIIVFLIYLFMLNLNLKNENVNLLDSVNYAQGIITDKWIVVTTINKPTEQCKSLSNINDFQLIVIGDVKTPVSWYLKGSTYLNLELQKSLHFKSFETTPLNSYNRKNIGYLYAIKNGAKYIYDTDDDNSPLVNLSSYFSFKSNDNGLIYDCKINTSVLNPYAHFGQPSIWPRGFPLNKIQDNYYNSYYSGRRKSSVIQQGVVNGDPDVDAIFRLTKSMDYKKIDLYFDESSPSIQIPLYKMSPYNSQNTLISYNAFWSLYLPNTVSFRLTDIWRSYWAQRLMWLLDDTVTFRGPSAYQMRNSHSYLKDFEQEQSMYLQTQNLMDFLFKWKCNKNKFYDCVIDLSSRMAENKFWDFKEVDSIKNWIDDLEKVGYQEPEIVNFEHYFEAEKINFQNCTIHRLMSEVRYTPKFQKSIDSDNYCCDGNTVQVYDKFEEIEYFKNICNLTNTRLDIQEKSTVSNSNLTLLVSFNRQVFKDNIVFMQNFYQEYFRNIVFCGKGILHILELQKNRGKNKRFDSYTFIELDTVNGNFHHYCMNKAIEMGFNTEGVLLMSDDVMLKYWNLFKLDTKKMWFSAKLMTTTLEGINSTINQWMWWNSVYGIPALQGTWKTFELILNGSQKVEEHELEILKRFIINLKIHKDPRLKDNSTMLFTNGFPGKGSDFFYLPVSKFESFYFINEIFRKNGVFLEISVPTILAGLDDDNSIQALNGTYSWGGGQVNLDKYNETEIYWHPAKISYLKSQKKFCQLFVQDKFSAIKS